ncbi:AMIN domain-containing protein, partial [Nioella sp.]
MFLVVSPPVAAQDLRALARVMGEGSFLRDGPGGGVELSLALSQAVPYRAFVLDAPARLVVDFREVTWTGLPDGFDEASSVTDVATGRGDAGWSRMVLSLSGPLGIARAEMR